MKSSKTLKLVAGVLAAVAGAIMLAEGIVNGWMILIICGAILVVLGVVFLIPRKKANTPSHGEDSAKEAMEAKNMRIMLRISGILVFAAGVLSLYTGLTNGRWASIAAGILLFASGTIDFVTAHIDALGSN